VGPQRPTTLDHDDSLLLVAGSIRGPGDENWWSQDDPRFERLRTALTANPASALSGLRGPFLLAFFDRRSGDALFAIDRAGIMTLCFALSESGDLLVATDATLLRQHPGLRVQLDPQALYNFLYFHMVPSPGTVFRGVRKLEPAQFLRWTDRRWSVQNWWQPSFQHESVGQLAQLRGELVPTLAGAVQRWRNRPSVGTFLSGGIDSSTVTGLVARGMGPAAAYSMGFSAAGYDETQYARIAAQHFGARLKVYYVEPDQVAAELFNVAHAYDEPFGNSSAVPTLLCARYARSDGAETLLAGDGGDELYAGNERYAKQKVFEWYQAVPHGLRAGLIDPLFANPARLPNAWPLSKIAAYVSQARQPMPDRLQSYNFLNRPESDSMFESSFLASVDTQEPGQLLRRTYDDLDATDIVDRMLHLDWKFTLADNDLRKVGRMCALGGVQVHYPWLDEDVVDLSLRLPGTTKMRGLKLRAFAKQALAGFLPEEVLTKTKHGFGLPFGEWLKTSPALQNVTYDLLRRFKPRGIVRPEFIDHLIRQHRDGHAAYFGTPVWVIAMLEAWMGSHALSNA
jgi:asparagine synthase (glutamine-hydrolysing)